MATKDVDTRFKKSARAATSAIKAARGGRCGEALDDLVVAVAAHHAGMALALPEVYREGHELAQLSRQSWMMLGTAKLAIRSHCLVNETGQGLEGARRRKRS